jgi:hypothetical protein
MGPRNPERERAKGKKNGNKVQRGPLELQRDPIKTFKSSHGGAWKETKVKTKAFKGSL